MDRLDSLGSINLQRTKKEKKKIGKKKPTKKSFSSLVDSSGSMSVDFVRNYNEINDEIPLEKLLDNVHELGEDLKNHPSVASILKYKEAVSGFLHYVVKESLETVTKEGSRYNPLKKQKRFTLIKVVNQKLERLAVGILQNHKDQLELLRRVDEIYGLLIDILG